MTGAIHKVLCSLDSKFRSLYDQWSKELQGVDSTLKSVSIGSNDVQQIAGRNPQRVELWIHNGGDKDLFLAPFDGDVTRNLYSIRIAPNDTLIMKSHNYAQMYKSDVYGFWADGASANSSAKVTEYYVSNR